MHDENDFILVRKLNGPHGRSSFDILYNRYSSKCRAFVFALTKDENVSADITQDVFIKIWLRRDLVSKVDSFSGYLFKIVKNAVLDYFESKAINRKYQSYMKLTTEELQNVTNEHVDTDELELIIYNAVHNMPTKRQKVFMLSRYNGLTNKAIAILLGIDVRTVERHISNALLDIRASLSKI